MTFSFPFVRYTLPDGRVIKIGHERFEAAEALFTPSLVEVEGPGMSDLVFDVINSAEMDLRTELYSHVVLSGGSTMYPGLPSVCYTVIFSFLFMRIVSFYLTLFFSI